MCCWAVEDDFEHRQALVRDQGRIDDGADAGPLATVIPRKIEAQQAVDLVLVQNPLAAGLTAFGGGPGVVAHRIRTRRHGGVLGGPLGHRGLIVSFFRHSRHDQR
jgi:hypothetical protein